MPPFQRVNINKFGRPVQVDTEDTANEIAAVKITAVAGQTTVEHTHTFGAVDGDPTPPSSEDVQKALDNARDKAAKKAAYRESLRESLEQAR
jgi:hypothetical protein